MRYFVASTFLGLAAGAVFLLRPFGVGELDNKALDALTRWAGPGEQSGRVVLVEVDDRSLAELGRWPWRRDLLGLLVRKILDRGASTVVLDMVFPEEDRQKPSGPSEDDERPPAPATNDEAFVAAMAGGPVVVGYVFAFERHPILPPFCDPAPLPLAIAGNEAADSRFFQATGVVCSVDTINRAAAESGFLNVSPDSDGIVRRVPLVIEYQDRQYPSLALAAVRADQEVLTPVMKTDGGGARELRLGHLSVPLEGPGLLRLRFRGPAGSFASIPVVEVLQEGTSSRLLEGKIAVVGITASAIKDTVSTPASPLFSGLELHGTAIDNLLRGDVFSRPAAAYAWELVLVLLAVAVATLMTIRFRGLRTALITAAVIFAVWAACAALLLHRGVLLTPLPASMAVACNYFFFTLFQHRAERRRADRNEEQLASVTRRTEAALKESERRYQRLVENVNDAIIVHDAEGHLVFANRRFREWFGLGDQDIRDVILENYVAPEWRWLVRDHHSRLVRGEMMPGVIEFEGIRADGGRLWIEALITTIEEDEQISGTQSALRDITERKRMEAQYLQAQKMESLGRLAGGIAHDFNNLLTVISGYSDMLLSQPELGGEDREYLEHIRNASVRAGELTQKLLAFSRQQVAHPKALDLNSVVSEAAGMYARLIGEDIELVTLLGEDLGLVKADPGQVSQILSNLVTNARDAMPEGGKLTIETRNVELDQELADQHVGLQPGFYVYLGVSDTGFGMDSETQQHVFEPFFTTKEPGKGTGLGLATVHGIVRQNGGAVWVDSQPGKGATFHIYLPRICGLTGSPTTEEASPDLFRVPPQTRGDSLLGERRVATNDFGGSETVLLVEDEAEVRNYSRIVLQRHGYRVLQASNGPEAIGLATRYPDVIHLLVTDVVLPRMSGFILAERLRQTRPEIRVLFTSGYPAHTDLEEVTVSGASYLQKPFDPEVLAGKVRGVLDA